MVWFLGSEVKGQGHKVSRCILHTNDRSIIQKRMIQSVQTWYRIILEMTSFFFWGGGSRSQDMG